MVSYFFLVALVHARITEDNVMFQPVDVGRAGEKRSVDDDDDNAFYNVVCPPRRSEPQCAKFFSTGLFDWDRTVRTHASKPFATLQRTLRAGRCLKVIVLGSSITAGSCGYAQQHPDCLSHMVTNRSLDHFNLPSDAIMSRTAPLSKPGTWVWFLERWFNAEYPCGDDVQPMKQHRFLNLAGTGCGSVCFAGMLYEIRVHLEDADLFLLELDADYVLHKPGHAPEVLYRSILGRGIALVEVGVPVNLYILFMLALHTLVIAFSLFFRRYICCVMICDPSVSTQIILQKSKGRSVRPGDQHHFPGEVA